MLIDGHVAKIRALRAVRDRLDPLEDFELWFWAGMHAGTHAVNAALHHAGATRAEASYATQPGVYLADAGDGTVREQSRPLADVLHVGRPPVPGPVPDDVARLMHAMEQVEHHRDPCVRGDRTPTAAIVAECEAALAQVFALLERRLGESTR